MLDVLFEDNHLLAVNKPAGLPVQGDASGDEHLLDLAAAWLQKKYNKPGLAFIGLIHRLDRPVSGVVVLAKTSKGLSRMNELFRSKQTVKIYHAITAKSLPNEEGTLIHHLGKDSKTHRALTYLKPGKNTKEAVLHYKLLKSGKNFLYEIQLETGRFHQIRAQMAKSGSPLLGDLKYGAVKALPDRSIGLHSYSLQFEHPITKENIYIQAKYPQKAWWDEFNQGKSS